MFQKLKKVLWHALAPILLLGTRISLASAQISIPNPLGANSSISSVITNIVNFIFNLGLALSVVMFMVGGFQYLFSGGSEDKAKQAKHTLLYAAIAVVILLIGKSFTSLLSDILGI